MQNIMYGKNYYDTTRETEHESLSSDEEADDNVIVTLSDDEVISAIMTKFNSNNQRHRDTHTTSYDCDDSLMTNNSSDYSLSGFEGFAANESTKKKAKRMSNTHRLSRKERFRSNHDRPTFELYDSSDDLCLRGTLDTIIPITKDFRGCNNPFSDEWKSNSTGSNGALLTKAFAAGFNFNMAMVPNNGHSENGVRMVRTIKRRLSAKDLHSDTKRRKLSTRRDEHIEVNIKRKIK